MLPRVWAARPLLRSSSLGPLTAARLPACHANAPSGRRFPTSAAAVTAEGAENVEDEHEIMFYSMRHAATVTLKEMHQFGAQANNKRALILAAQFLHEELPIRLARRVRELKKLPYGLGDTKSITQVRKMYEKSFFEIRRHAKPITPDLEANFTKLMDNMMVEHNNVQATIAAGLQELDRGRTDMGETGQQRLPFDFGQFLDRFYLSRVGMRVLVGQHIMLHHPQEGFIGIIQSECQPAFVCGHAIEDAQ
ncbi:mitochondrial branched-chain alpha-ketoacid dehydrogenase kinase-domain-containing protein, partial [Baffinella frigidus]